MKLNGRLGILLGSTALCAVLWSTAPYWDAVVKSPETWRGRRAREEVQNDTFRSAARRAAIGGGIGVALGLLLCISPDYREPRQ